MVIGFLRSIRHPERYGPRGSNPPRRYPYNYDDPSFNDQDPTDGNGALPPQTRTAGLARAIVDSFPIVRYVRRRPHGEGAGGKKPSEGAGEDEVWGLNLLGHRGGERENDGQEESKTESIGGNKNEGSVISSRRRSRDGTGLEEGAGVEMAGEKVEETEESCPICLLEFEEGDDLRILACPGKHHFHKGSSGCSCPSLPSFMLMNALLFARLHRFVVNRDQCGLSAV